MNRVLLLSVLALFLSCSKSDPVACFVIPDSRIETNVTYKFSNCSDNTEDFTWDFGDGNFSQESEPIHSYAEPGTYTVSLLVKNDGKQDELKRTLSTFKNDLTTAAAGTYSGTYTETYPDSSIMDKTYNGSSSITAIDLKNIEVGLSRGNYKALVSGDMAIGFDFSTITEPNPTRIESMTGEGTFRVSNNTFTFTLTGTDPFFGDTPWIISFTGTKI